MHGAGHGFGGEQGSEASEALLKWFDKYLAQKDGKTKKAAEPAAAGSR
jgi:hypothetical protein